MSDRIESAGVSCVGDEPGVLRASTFSADAVKLDDQGRRTAGVPEPEFEGAFQATAAESLADDDHARANHPSEILHDPKLSVEQKRNLLLRWALDAYNTLVATRDGMPSSASSRVDEAIDALIDLDGGTAAISKLSIMRSAKAGDRARAA